MSARPAVTTRREVAIDALAEALRGETQLIVELNAILLRQREGIAAHDYLAVENSVRAMSRVVLTLDAARRCRNAISGTLGGPIPLSLADLEDAIGAAPPALRAVRTQVREAAGTAAANIRINESILRRALDAGDEYLRSLFGAATTGGLAYRPDRDAGTPSVFLDRSV